MKAKCIGVAMLLAASTAWTPAFAADLGGDCCADLEERVAELEATTARKGNRKVSLTISGHVNELVYWFDDGTESNVYVGTSGYASSRFRFKGDAKISADWSAGYYIEIETVSAQVSSNTAGNDDGTGEAIRLRHSAWYLQSKQLGTVWVGLHSHATDNIILFANGGTGFATAANHNVAPGSNLTFRGSTLELNDLFDFIDTDRANIIRYDSPSIAGFVFSASWGEDDMWDVALTYAGEFSGFKIAGGIGYHVERDVTGDAGYNLGELYNVNAPDFDQVSGSISVLHAPSGLFVDFAGLWRSFDQPQYDDFTYWMLRGGIFQKFFAVGKTSIFGEYAEASNSANAGFTLDRMGLISADGTLYGVGINQHIDAAAMEIYAGWRHFEADLTTAAGAVATDDIDTVYMGAGIKF